MLLLNRWCRAIGLKQRGDLARRDVRRVATVQPEFNSSKEHTSLLVLAKGDDGGGTVGLVETKSLRPEAIEKKFEAPSLVGGERSTRRCFNKRPQLIGQGGSITIV